MIALLPTTSLDDLAARLGVPPESALLRTALTHSTYAAEHDVEANERLEFLGDAVVSVAIADLIVREFPELNEGTGSLVRSRVVNETALAHVAESLDLGAHLRVGRGARREGASERPSILADAFEAVVAAVYLEIGFDAARQFVVEQLRDAVVAAAAAPRDVDPKTQLLQWAEAANLGAPRYHVVANGPSHDAHYEATVVVGPVTATGEGRSKKAAEVAAARAAWKECGARNT